MEKRFAILPGDGIGVDVTREAVKVLAKETDLVLVLGSQNSSNSQRLRELAEENGIAAYLLDGRDDIQASWFEGVETVLITAGASAPESVVDECIQYLKDHYNATVEVRTIREEDVHFPLPRPLRALSKSK